MAWHRISCKNRDVRLYTPERGHWRPYAEKWLCRVTLQWVIVPTSDLLSYKKRHNGVDIKRFRHGV